MSRRHTGRYVVAALGGLVLLLGLLLYFFNWNTLRPYIARKSKEMTGRELLIAGNLGLKFSLPPRLSADDVSFENAPWAKGHDLFNAKHVEFRVALWPLLQRRIVFTDLRLDGALVELERQNGFGNWSITTKDAAAKIEQAERTHTPEQPGPEVVFQDISIRHSHLDYVDKSLPLFVHVDVNKAQIAGSATHWLIHDADLIMGMTEVQGKLDLDVAGLLKMRGDLYAPRVHIDDLTALTGAKKAAAPATGGSKGDQEASGPLLSSAPISFAWMKAFQADFDVKVHRLTKAGRHQDLLDEGALELHLRDGRLDVPHLTFLSGGKVSANGILNAAKLPAKLDLSVAFQRLDVGQLIDKAVAGIKDKEEEQGTKVPKPVAKEMARVQDNTYGLLGGQITLASVGDSMHDFAKNLQGKVGFAMENGHVSDVLTYITELDLGKTIIRYLQGDHGSNVQCLVTTFNIDRGDAVVDTALLSTKEANIRAKGDINLAAESIQMTITTYPKKISLDSLRAPITISGPLTKPKVKPQTAGLVARVGAAVALGALVAPPAAILPFVEAGLGKKGACAQHVAELTAVQGSISHH